jgi:hypothetical protein
VTSRGAFSVDLPTRPGRTRRGRLHKDSGSVAGVLATRDAGRSTQPLTIRTRHAPCRYLTEGEPVRLTSTTMTTHPSVSMAATRIYFLSGAFRSGTTVITEALAEALGAPVLTLGDLGRYIPPLATFLARLDVEPLMVDRGVDDRLVSPDFIAEYCWFLLARSRPRRFTFRPSDSNALCALATAVATRNGDCRVVMKNTWDVGSELSLLQAFPACSVVLIRRRLPSIEASIRQAFRRHRADYDYTLSLFGSSLLGPIWVWCLQHRVTLRAVTVLAIWRTRLRILRAACLLRRLPLRRVALISYDELVSDAAQGAALASGLVDAGALARAFKGRYRSTGEHDATRGSLVARTVDLYWERCWLHARARQRACEDPG